MRRARVAAAAAVVVLATLAAGGCGGGGDDDGSNADAPPVGADSPALLRELAQVRATDRARAWTTYGDLAAQRALGDGTAPSTLFTLSGYGWPTTQARDVEARGKLGLSGAAADRAIEIGETHGTGRFDGGVDTGAVADGAKRLGGHEDGSAGPLTVWRLAADDAVAKNGDIAQLSRGSADFNVIAVGKDTVVRAQSAAAAKDLAADNKGDTLARDPEVRAVADCLGTPLAATFSDRHITAGGASPKPADFTTGAGVTGSDPKKLTQVACRTTGSAAEAKRTATALRTELAHGTTRLSRLPWNTMLADAKVSVVAGTTVKVTATSKKSPQVVLEMMRSGDLSDLLDTSG
ncbi:hypothetical protein [Streptomyces sp. NPDC050560]|uniref:hypothetical protein n=1 Tax=Streptomyces sp. NPDC050560 TaxID=3365630 RepID=UPI0037A22839